MGDSTDPLVALSANLAGLKVIGKIEDGITECWYKGTLKYKLQQEGDSIVPKYWVTTRLFQCLRQRFSHHTKEITGMTYVYFGERRSGKTLAARGALQLFVTAFEGKMPSLLVECDGGLLSYAFRAVLGTPTSMSDSVMLSNLCSTLRDHDLNSLRRCPPLIVIDGLGTVTEADYRFISRLYKLAYETRILVFIFCDKEVTANILCGMNGKQRIRPLEGMFSGADVWSIAELENHSFADSIAGGIGWEGNNWNVKKLSKLCKLRFPEFNFVEYKQGDKYTFVNEGDLPDAAMNRAAAIVANSEDKEASSEVLNDPRYDEDDNF